MGTVGYLALAVAAAALAIVIIRSAAHRARAPALDDPDAAFEQIVAGLRAGRLALDPHILDNAPPERRADL